MSYHLLKLLSGLCCWLPRRFCDRIGNLLASFLWIFVPKWRKKMAEKNVMQCLDVDEKEAKRIAKASSVRFGPMLFEVLRFPHIKQHMEEYVRIEGLEHLKDAMALGRGAIIATSHSGNWELMGGAFAQAGIPLVGVAMKQKNDAADKFINEYRALIGMHITYKTGVREMFKMLEKGWAIGLLMDQDTTLHDGIRLDFFGRETNCTPGAASMARFRDAPICSAFMRREGNIHILEVHPAVFVEKTKDKKEDIKRTTQILVKECEENIRAYPEEWFWLHNRWKSMEDGIVIQNGDLLE